MLDIKINNTSVKVDQIDITGVTQSSLVLIGDADVVDCVTQFDTPKDSLIISKQVPIKQEVT